MNPANTSIEPWYHRVRRWGQTNLTEVDPRDCDIGFWRSHWRNTGTQYITCINSAYYKEHIPDILREIGQMYAPDGFTDNSWTGLSRNGICHCPACREKFSLETGHPHVPDRKDWADLIYRDWLRWSHTCRIENWDLFNRVTQATGGQNCLWLGMINANPISTHAAFCDLKRIAARSPILMCDHQSRDALNGFEQNSLNGALLHGLTGPSASIPESMAGYARGSRTFRRNSMPAAELTHWMLEGIAGGLTPWWHCIGGVQEDHRMLATQTEVLSWHRDNEPYLFDRTPIAPVGLVWSQENNEFYGQDELQERVGLPWRGLALALREARIPFVPVHADHIARDAESLSVLAFPGMAVLTDDQIAAIRAFAATGKGLMTGGLFARLDFRIPAPCRSVEPWKP